MGGLVCLLLKILLRVVSSQFHCKHKFYVFPWNVLHFLKSLECIYVTAIISNPKNPTKRESGYCFVKGNQPCSQGNVSSSEVLFKVSAGSVQQAFNPEMNFISKLYQLQTPQRPQNTSSRAIPTDSLHCPHSGEEISSSDPGRALWITVRDISTQ